MSKRGLTVLLLALAFAAGLFPRSILCIGTDGHVAIEAMVADCCQATAEIDGGQSGRCAEECADTQLGLSSASRTSERLDFPTSVWHALPVAKVVLASIAASSATILLAAGSEQIVPPPRSLRTTVDLC